MSFPSLSSPSSPATFIKSLSMIMHTSVDFLFFDFLCLMLFSSLPLQSPTLDPGLCHYLWPPGKKKKRVKKNRYPFSVLQADQDLDRSGLTLSVITCFLTLTSVLFVNIFKSFASNPCPCINPPRLQLTESFVMCHC